MPSAVWRAVAGPSHLASAELSVFLREASLAEIGASTVIVTCEPASGPLGVTMGSEPNAGARVCAIEPHSRAEQAGLRVGDRILKVNGEKAKGALEAKELIEESSQRRQPIKLTVLRARQVQRLPATCVLERRMAELQCSQRGRRRDSQSTRRAARSGASME
mmetsp:Transcript_16031/g.34813  ORF Transcript_16031/g.34813 Transcript_16031/m.34813 type:complete len:162 (-) Transcript_16031:425-910(-)